MTVTHSLDACLAILVSGSNLLNSWRATHILDVFLISISHSHVLQSYQFALQKTVSYHVSLIFPMNATYILPIFHQPNFHCYSTRYCTHILHHM